MHSGVYLTCILPVYCQCIHVVYVFNVYSGSIFRTVFQYIQAPVGKCSVSDAKVPVYSYCIQENTSRKRNSVPTCDPDGMMKGDYDGERARIFVGLDAPVRPSGHWLPTHTQISTNIRKDGHVWRPESATLCPPVILMG